MNGLYEENNEVWELILERFEYVVEIVNPGIPEYIPMTKTVDGTTFGVSYTQQLFKGTQNE